MAPPTGIDVICLFALLLLSAGLCVWASGGITEWQTWGLAIGAGVIGSAAVAATTK